MHPYRIFAKCTSFPLMFLTWSSVARQIVCDLLSTCSLGCEKDGAARKEPRSSQISTWSTRCTESSCVVIDALLSCIRYAWCCVHDAQVRRHSFFNTPHAFVVTLLYSQWNPKAFKWLDPVGFICLLDPRLSRSPRFPMAIMKKFLLNVPTHVAIV